MTLVPCFNCGTILSPAAPDATFQPSGGTAFTSPGHYGSTFWDPMSAERLGLIICDDCLSDLRHRLVRITPTPQPDPTISRF